MIAELTPEEKNRLVDGYEHLHAILKRLLLFEDEVSREREHFWVIGFQTLDYVKYVELVALGHLNGVAILPREAYRMAVHQGCNRVIMAHNHPSGNLKFSRADVELTRRMIAGGEILGIDLMDHLVVSLEGYKPYFNYKGGSPFPKTKPQ
jgi:DNA repair protein RadC